MSKSSCTKPIHKHVDNSKLVRVEIIDDTTGEIFGVSIMPYMTALVFEAVWIRAHVDQDRSIRIVQ